MCKLQYIIILMAMLVSTKAIKAQIPINDPAWIYQTSLSDDFNGTSLDGTKWYMQTDSTPGKGLEMMFHRNVKFTGGALRIKVDTLDPNRTYNSTTYKYQSGTVISTGNGKYGYSYVEIRAKFPTGHKLYWPALWFEKDTCTLPLTTSWYEEIDPFENADIVSFNGNQISSNWHIYDTGMPDTTGCDPGSQGTSNFSVNTVCCNLKTAFHKYAISRDANEMNFYFDDTLIRTIYDPINVPKHGLNAIMDIYITNWLNPATLPHMAKDSMVVDYFYTYKLNGDCINTLTISSPTTDYYNATPKRAVKKSILSKTVGASSPTYNLSDNCTLRATDYIILDEGTTINAAGSGQFSVLIAPCPN
jgi:beta-glucanase (GH16 family)